MSEYAFDDIYSSYAQTEDLLEIIAMSSSWIQSDRYISIYIYISY